MKHGQALVGAFLIQACVYCGANQASEPARFSGWSPRATAGASEGAAPRAEKDRFEFQVRARRQEIWVRRPGASAWHLLLRAPSHVLFHEPRQSPNGRWLTLRELGPVRPKGRVDEVSILVDLRTGSRIRGSDFRERFGLERNAAFFDWVEDKPATLEVNLVSERGHGGVVELDLTLFEEKDSRP